MDEAREHNGELTHVGPDGAAHMVDVGEKDQTRRTATAAGFVRMKPETLSLIRDNRAKKGDVIGVARVAGIMAAKRTAGLIPLCHAIPLTGIDIEFDLNMGDNRVQITATACTIGQTGVEMEALTAVSVAALTIYDMCKAVDRGMLIDRIRLIRKDGGKSGTYRVEDHQTD